ncbi:MAG: hypothetical protein CL675_11210 [Bdellovibrionaceae bacterium]|nr:hypothetical protein [Pseudobdellovibrionaceae bacterium]
MMSGFVTIESDNRDHRKLLDGESKDGHWALPVDSFRYSDGRERTTFRLVEANPNKPSFATRLWVLLRPSLISMTLGPLFLVLAYGRFLDTPMNFAAFATSFFGLLFLHIATFAYNDYFDHLRGIDRYSQDSGSQVIQKGWFRAKVVRRIADVSMLGAAVSGLIIFVSQPELLVLASLMALAAAFGFSSVRLGLKTLGIGEMIVFVSLGPGLVYGLSKAVLNHFDISLLFLGLLMGTLSSLVMQVRNWQQIFVASRFKLGTFVSRLGFDRSKYFIHLHLVLASAYFGVLIYSDRFAAWAVPAVIPLGLLVYRFVQHVNETASPFSSKILNLDRRAVRLHQLMIVTLILVFELTMRLK